MQHQIYIERDATIYERKEYRNTGIDQILELVKTTSGSRLDDQWQVGTYNTRILLDFAGTQFTDLSQSIHNGNIGSTDRKFYLNLKHIYSTDLPITYTLYAYPVSESWSNGTGNYADIPEARNGASWRFSDNYDDQTAWNTGSAHSIGQIGVQQPLGGGTWITGSGYEASQSFDYQSPDVRMDVTDIVNKWLAGTIPNYGFILKQQYSTEVGDSNSLNLKFFSKDTHTVYAPKLEVVWNDYTLTGTTDIVHQTNNGGPIVYFKNIEEKYPEGSRVKFRLGARSKYPTKTYTTASFYTTDSRLTKTSSYAVCDAVTGETLLDYDDVYTKISDDANGSYFNYWMNALSPERYYKFKIRSKYSDSEIKYFDNGYYFKVVR
jgi:hypothetical protein